MKPTELDKADHCIEEAMNGNPYPFMAEYLFIRTKANDFIKLKLARIQEYVAGQLTGSDIVCKPRQVFISTLNLARAFTFFYCIPYYQAALLAHHKESTTRMFKAVDRFYQALPSYLRSANPVDHSRAEYLTLKGTESSFYIGTAGNREFGRGDTVNFAMISEEAHYQENAQELIIPSILGAVSNVANGITVRESTPNGVGNTFEIAYHEAQEGEIPFNPIFVPWYWHEEYFYPVDHHKVLKADRGLLEYTEEELMFIEKVRARDGIEISEDQMRFRRSIKAEFKEKVQQEYPEDDVTCWLSSQQSKFDLSKLRMMLLSAIPPIARGKDLNEPIHDAVIFRFPQPWATYTIGADVSEGLPGGDYSYASVLCDQTGEEVANLHCLLNEEAFSKRTCDLGKFYNNATIAFERTAYGQLAIRAAQRAGYPHLYKYREPGQALVDATVGYPTVSQPKKIQLIDSMVAAIDTGSIRVHDKMTLQELTIFKKHTDNSYGAPKGKHDDRAMGVMIAYWAMLDKPSRLRAGRERGSAVVRSNTSWP